MRSLGEITFRLRQEAANVWMYILPSNPHVRVNGCRSDVLPRPEDVADAVRGTAYEAELLRIADCVIAGKIPVLGSEVDYGQKVAWRRDPRSGVETAPKYFRLIPYLDAARAGDHKLIWEINRHQHLVLLAQAAILSGRQEYQDTVFRQLEHWWVENPFQRGMNWASALEVAFRALSWVWIWHLIGPVMSEAFKERFLIELYRHAAHLEYNLSIYFSPNTHLLGEAVALAAIGRLVPDLPNASRWRELGGRITREQIQSQVHGDGSHFEQSTYYHMYALDFFLFYAVLEETPAEYRQALWRMAEYLAAVAGPSGNLPLIGDDDGGRLFHPFGDRGNFARATLATASAVLDHSFFAYTHTDSAEIALWWLGKGSLRPLPAADGRGSRVFRDAGIVIMEAGDVHAIFDTGTFGTGNAGHSHADTLAIVIRRAADEILIDSGTCTYVGDPDERDYFRGTSAHNTIRIDKQDQAIPSGPFRWLEKPDTNVESFSTSPDEDSAVGVCRYRGFTHRRRIRFRKPDLFDIVDEIQGPPGEHLIEQFWHMQAASVETTRGTWRIGNAAELNINGGEMEQSWRSRSLGSKEPSSRICIRQRSTLPVELHAQVRVLLK